MKFLKYLLVFLLFATPVCAQYVAPVTLSPAQSAVVTTSAAQCVAPQGNIRTLLLFNNGSTTVWVRPADGTAPATNQAGSVPIPSGTGLFWEQDTAPRNGMNCIASSGTDNLTVWVGT